MGQADGHKTTVNKTSLIRITHSKFAPIIEIRILVALHAVFLYLGFGFPLARVLFAVVRLDPVATPF